MSIRFVSTRGEAEALDFEGAMLTGLAPDGGLYLPEVWPRIAESDLIALRGRPYAEVAASVLSRFTGESIPVDRLRAIVTEAYAGFGHPAVTPLKQLDSNLWLLELFHGPTLAFKDVAMQVVSRLMDFALEKRGERATIIGATSGDTGGAAIEAFKSSGRVTLFVLHPKGRVSEVQRRQMTTVNSPTVHNVALEGSFDDCQAIVKALFNDGKFRDGVRLSGVNSINWARIAAQAVYYFFSALALGGPQRNVSFTVPTGNFGDVFAGYAAKRMGLPIDRLVIATNVNDILDRTLKTGRYEIHAVSPSSSPSMDIQISSNFERLLFESSGRDSAATRRLMANLAQGGAFGLVPDMLGEIRKDFDSGKADEDAVASTIRETVATTNELLDPHSAVGLSVARSHRHGQTPMISLATAHPAKFPEAVAKACGIRPELPPRLSDLLSAREKFSVLPNDAEAVKSFILGRVASE